MIKRILLKALIVSISIVLISCQKENNSDGARFRLTKIADNIAMENPTVFEYNPKGLLSKITNEYSSHEINYNTNGQPIKISEYDLVWSTTTPMSVTQIEWNNDGFIASDSNSKDIFQLNSQGRIIKKIELYKGFSQQVFDTLSVSTYSWTNDNLLKRKCTYPTRSGNDSWEVNYKFGTGWSPFKGANIALIATGAIGLSFCEEFQTTFCTIESNYIGRYLDKTVVTYDLNEQNYPIRADEYSTDADGSSHDYDYFKYESF